MLHSGAGVPRMLVGRNTTSVRGVYIVSRIADASAGGRPLRAHNFHSPSCFNP